MCLSKSRRVALPNTVRHAITCMITARVQERLTESAGTSPQMRLSSSQNRYGFLVRLQLPDLKVRECRHNREVANVRGSLQKFRASSTSSPMIETGKTSCLDLSALYGKQNV